MTLYPSCLVDGICAAIHAGRPARGTRFVAIDGPGCAGKSTLADLVQQKHGETAITIGLDDFFVPLHSSQMTGNRMKTSQREFRICAGSNSNTFLPKFETVIQVDTRRGKCTGSLFRFTG